MKEYYNVLESGYKVFEISVFGLVIVAIGITVIIVMKKINAKQLKLVFMYIWTGFGLLWTIFASIGAGSEYFTCVNAMKNGTCREIEGLVENFDPMPYSGHKNESFTVKGVKFEYSDFGYTAGFNQTRSHGGPIGIGKYVRIKYFEGKILQLWIKE